MINIWRIRITNYVIERLNSNPFDGPIRDAVVGDVGVLTDLQLQKSPDLGFVDRFGDEFNNFTITGNWFRNTLNRGQLANDGALHQINFLPPHLQILNLTQLF